MTILVTGGAGFIGSALIRHLVTECAESVVNFDKLTYAGNPQSVAAVSSDSRYAFVEADICDAAAVRDALQEHRPRAICHLAAESHVDRSIEGPADFIQTNLGGTFTLLDEAHAYWSALGAQEKERFRFLHVSTDEVFGSLGDTGRFDEKSPYKPNSPYSATKAGSDHLARAWHRTYGLPVIVSNCSNNYGPCQYPEKLIPRMILSALEGQSLPLYGDGQNVRDWLYVEDHAAALARIVESGRPGETYVISGRAERANIDLVRDLCAIFDDLLPDSAHRPHDKLIEFVADRPGHDFRYAIDDSKIRGELGWASKESLDSGLRKTVEWYLDNRSWWEPVRLAQNAGDRLGLDRRRTTAG